MGTDAKLVGIYKIDYDREYNLFPVGFDDELLDALKDGKGLSTEMTLVYLSQVIKYWEGELWVETEEEESEKIKSRIEWVKKVFDKVKKMPDDMVFVSVNDHEGLMKESLEIDNHEREL